MENMHLCVCVRDESVSKGVIMCKYFNFNCMMNEIDGPSCVFKSKRHASI
jgi:hypothetical protein